jgi:hypothetical protein
LCNEYLFYRKKNKCSLIQFDTFGCTIVFDKKKIKGDSVMDQNMFRLFNFEYRTIAVIYLGMMREEKLISKIIAID